VVEFLTELISSFTAEKGRKGLKNKFAPFFSPFLVNELQGTSLKELITWKRGYVRTAARRHWGTVDSVNIVAA
jgi:hypothetical protein